MTDLDRLKGYQHGAVDYLSVPVVPELLRAKVKVFAELHRKTQQLEALNARMTTLQDEERRRIARELHDSVGQLLAAVSMNSALVQAESHKLSPEAAKRVHENAAMVEEATKEIRTISHLLHPPLLDEAGLASALHCYVEGFSERSKIVAKLAIPQSFEGLSKEMELSIFRVVQECLTNIHRHAGSPTAEIRITQDEACLRVEIEDAGKGIPPEKESLFRLSAHTGVGLRGMSERLRQLGGTLQIQSNGHGTQVITTLPVARTPVVHTPRVDAPNFWPSPNSDPVSDVKHFFKRGGIRGLRWPMHWPMSRRAADQISIPALGRIRPFSEPAPGTAFRLLPP